MGRQMTKVAHCTRPLLHNDDKLFETTALPCNCHARGCYCVKTLNQTSSFRQHEAVLTHDLGKRLFLGSSRGRWLVLRSPLVVTPWPHMNLPVILQQVPEVFVGPRGGVSHPGTLKATATPRQGGIAAEPTMASWLLITNHIVMITED